MINHQPLEKLVFSLQSPATDPRPKKDQKGMTQGHADSPRQKASGQKTAELNCWAVAEQGEFTGLIFHWGKCILKTSSTIKCDMFSKTGHLNLYKPIPTQKVFLPKTWIPATVAFLSSVAQGKVVDFSKKDQL